MYRWAFNQNDKREHRSVQLLEYTNSPGCKVRHHKLNSQNNSIAIKGQVIIYDIKLVSLIQPKTRPNFMKEKISLKFNSQEKQNMPIADDN